MNIIQKLEQGALQELTQSKKIPEFKAGDTLRVLVNVVEGDRKRVQAFEGVCIARKNASLNSSFTVRKISYGEGVERVFPLYSPLINVEVVRQGDVRRAKLYYLRGRTGKSARIKEKAYWLSKSASQDVGSEDTDTLLPVAIEAELPVVIETDVSHSASQNAPAEPVSETQA